MDETPIRFKEEQDHKNGSSQGSATNMNGIKSEQTLKHCFLEDANDDIRRDSTVMIDITVAAK